MQKVSTDTSQTLNHQKNQLMQSIWNGNWRFSSSKIFGPVHVEKKNEKKQGSI